MREQKTLLNRKWFIVSYYYRNKGTFMVGGIRAEKLSEFLIKKNYFSSLVTGFLGSSTKNHIHIKDSLNKNKRLSSIMGVIFPLDNTALWVFKVVRFLKKQNPSIILTTIPPFGVSLVGLLLKKQQNNHFWILDYRDPWTLNVIYRPVFYAFKKHIAQYLEPLCLKQADVVILNTEMDLQNHLAKFPFIKDKAIVVRNGFDQFHPNTFTNNKETNIIKIVYMGSAYHRGIAAKALSDFILKINDLPDIELHCDYYGEGRSSLSENKFISFKGQIPYDKVPATLSQYRMGIIYLPPKNINSGRITQKFYDYIGSGVLPIIINPSTEMKIQLNKIKVGVQVLPEHDLQDISMQIKKQYFSNFYFKKETLNEFTRGVQFKKLLSFLNARI